MDSSTSIEHKESEAFSTGKTYVVEHLGMYIGTRESTTRFVLTSLKFTLEEWKDVTHAPAVHSDNCR